MTAQEIIIWILYVFVSFLCGIAASTISLSSWFLVVPLMFAIWRFGVFPSIFIAVAIDLTNYIVLTCIYAYNKKVVFASGLILGLIQASVSTAVSFWTEHLLLRYSNFLRGGIAVIPFVLGFIFLVRFIIVCYKNHRKKKQTIEQNEKYNDFNVTLPNSEVYEKGYQSGGYEINYDHSDASESASHQSSKWLTRFAAKEEAKILFNFNLRFLPLRTVLIIIMVILSGVNSGFLYTSGGFIVNLGFTFIFGQKQKYATATSSTVALIVMFLLSLTFITRPETFTIPLLYRLAICVPLSGIGSILGAIFVLRISDAVMYCVIAVTMVVLGVLGSIIPYL